jgi:hypothetical protein
MATVGYLFGAGASAQCIPVVSGMADDILLLIKDLAGFITDTGVYISGKNYGTDSLNEAIKVLAPLSEVCENYYSIDTYAKKLFLTDKRAFQKLKLDLCLYFTLRQVITKPDKRYDNFFSSIITSKETLPKRVKIISWNYDFQVEKSFSEYIYHEEFDGIRSYLGMISPNEYIKFSDYQGRFNVLKLNGSARIETQEHKGYLFNSLSKSKEELVREIVKKYFEIVEHLKYACELKFAWENDNYENLFQVAASELAQITVLVIIGYSFPFFNRDVDIQLFKSMPGLKTIYIQDLDPKGIEETMREFYSFGHHIKGLVNVIYKTNLTQYVFPNELDVTS